LGRTCVQEVGADCVRVAVPNGRLRLARLVGAAAVVRVALLVTLVVSPSTSVSSLSSSPQDPRTTIAISASTANPLRMSGLPQLFHSCRLASRPPHARASKSPPAREPLTRCASNSVAAADRLHAATPTTRTTSTTTHARRTSTGSARRCWRRRTRNRSRPVDQGTAIRRGGPGRGGVCWDLPANRTDDCMPRAYHRQGGRRCRH
jgi:hypothetical protein